MIVCARLQLQDKEWCMFTLSLPLCLSHVKRHPEGVGSVAFKEIEAAELCVTKMNGRWYGGRKLEVITWDGLTDYQVEETHGEREVRLKQWEDFLETGTTQVRVDLIKHPWLLCTCRPY